MRLHVVTKEGESKGIDLSEDPLTIGRSPNADVLILDEKVSRVHCGIRFWDGEFLIKDLKSKNGTFVNNVSIDIHHLRPGDKLRVGSTVLIFQQELSTDPDTAILAMQEAYQGGEGYSTILREIVDEGEKPILSDDSSSDSLSSTRAVGNHKQIQSCEISELETNEGDTKPAAAPPRRKRMVLDSQQGDTTRKGKATPKRKPLKIKVRKPESERQ